MITESVHTPLPNEQAVSTGILTGPNAMLGRARFSQLAASGSTVRTLSGPDIPAVAEHLELAAKRRSTVGSARDACSPMLWIDDDASSPCPPGSSA